MATEDPGAGRPPHPPCPVQSAPPSGGPHRLPLALAFETCQVRLVFPKTTCSKVLPGPEYTPEGLGGFCWWNCPPGPAPPGPASPSLGTALGSHSFGSPHCFLSGQTTALGAESVLALEAARSQASSSPRKGCRWPGRGFVSTPVRWHNNPLSASKVCRDLGTAPGMPRGSRGLQLLLGTGSRKPGAGNRADLHSGPC